MSFRARRLQTSPLRKVDQLPLVSYLRLVFNNLCINTVFLILTDYFTVKRVSFLTDSVTDCLILSIRFIENTREYYGHARTMRRRELKIERAQLSLEYDAEYERNGQEYGLDFAPITLVNTVLNTGGYARENRLRHARIKTDPNFFWTHNDDGTPIL